MDRNRPFEVQIMSSCETNEGGQCVGTGRTFKNIKDRQTELLLTLEPTQTIRCVPGLEIIYSRKS